MDLNETLAAFRRLMAEADKLGKQIEEIEAKGETPHSDLFHGRDDLWAEAAQVAAKLDEQLTAKRGPLPKEWTPPAEVFAVSGGWIVARRAIAWYGSGDPEAKRAADRYCASLNGEHVPGIYPHHNEKAE